MKRIISLVLCFVCLFSLFGCTLSNSRLTVNGETIDKEIYNYYLSVAQNHPNYEQSKNQKLIAKELCAQYVAVNNLAWQYDVYLSAENKVTLANETKVQWQLFSDFYERHNVSKQALGDALHTQALIKAITLKLYSPGGEREVSESEIKNYFNKNYISVKIAKTDFKGTESSSEMEDILQKFVQMRSMINSGGEITSVLQQYPGLTHYDDNTVIISSFDTSYPSDFFENIVSLKINSTQVLRYDNCIYLVQKCDNSEFFRGYKDNCIVKMKKSEIVKEIESMADSYSIRG